MAYITPGRRIKRLRLLNKRRNKIIILAIIAVALVIFGLLFHYRSVVAPIYDFKSKTKQNSSTSSDATKSVDLNSYYHTDLASSLDVVVDKGRVLPSNYVPAGLVVPNTLLRTGSGSDEMHLRPEAAKALENMSFAASKDGIRLMLASGYRSYQLQVGLYNGYVKSSGQAAADISSARPGHSEHQTGLAADLEPASRKCEVDQCFGNTPEGVWLAANAYKYGFIIRYPKDKDNLTGYEYEPWHVRYLGLDLAAKVFYSGKTLEQYFSLPNYTSYPTSSLQLK